MTLGFQTRKRARRKWAALGLTVATLTLLGSSVAQGTIGSSTFEGNDGNLAVNTTGNTDWATVAGLHTGIDIASGKKDNSFGQGTKEDDPAVTVVTGSIPPNKNDLTRFYEASQVISGNVYLYLAWERAVNIGSANLDFEINQKVTTGFNGASTGNVTLNRTAGDLLVTYDFGGSGTPVLGTLRWVTSASVPTVTGFATNVCFSGSFPCWGDHGTLNGSNSEGAVNTASISEPFAGGTLGTGLFGEASINLTAGGVFPVGACEAFGSTYVKSRSSTSFSAEMKDFIAPQPVSVSNCATVITRKTTVPSTDTHSFGFTTTVTTLPATTTSPFSLANGESNSIANVPAGSYSTTEDTATGYTLTSIDCSASTGVTPTTAGRTASYTVDAGDVVDCTYTNTKDKANPDALTAPSLIPQDKATVSGFDATGSQDGTITFSLWDNATCTGTALYTKSRVVTANGDYATDNTGLAASSGYTITADGTYNWKVVYAGDTRNNGFTKACGAEKVVVDITPDPASS